MNKNSSAGRNRRLALEVLEQRRLLAVDFGDAPDPYPTLLVENGARHDELGPTLGANRDTEADGQPTPGADGDDINGTDDEDGVTFGTIMVGQLDASVTVNVQNAPSGARLDAWIDLNGDGSWGGPFDHVADNVAVTDGDNTIEFDVPSWAADGTTYARFRLSTTGGLGVGGLASDGEVEDYTLTIDPPAETFGLFTPQQVIGSHLDATSVFAADMDGDGDTDVLSTSRNFFNSDIRWYENDGDPVEPGFTARLISTEVVVSTSVFAADVDGDGDNDVIGTSAYDDKIFWYENDGGPGVPAFTERTLTTDADGAVGVFAADVDLDGDTDIISAAYYGNEIAWYENNGGPGVPTFTKRIVSTDASGAGSVFAADVDGDGHTDLLSASFLDDKIAWYENNGGPGVPTFTERIISTAADGVASIFAADVDDDGDMDVLSASFEDDKIAWYENIGGPGVPAFTERIISTVADGARTVFAADVDGDGDTDVLGALFYDDTIVWYENNGGPGAPEFTEHILSTDADRAFSVFAADVDGDGDLDVLSASQGDDKIAWYENAVARLLGDMDLDGDVDLDDVNDFVQGLTEEDDYEATYGVPPAFNGDVDQDGDLDLDDADDFVDLLTGNGGGSGSGGTRTDGRESASTGSGVSAGGDSMVSVASSPRVSAEPEVLAWQAESGVPLADLSAGWFTFTSIRSSALPRPTIRESLFAAPDKQLAGPEAVRLSAADDGTRGARVVPFGRSARGPLRTPASDSPGAALHDAILAERVDWLARHRI